jgi:hypothetical protein
MKFPPRFLLIIVLFPLATSAQTYYPGYVIKNNGDTTKGYIKYKRWEQNPKAIQFKPGAEAKATMLSVNDIRYFSIDIGYPLDFQKYTGPVSTDGVRVDDIATFRDTGYRLDTVFLKILRKGNNTILFSYDDALKTRFFVADAKALPVELIYRTYFADDVNGQKRTVNEDTYKKQMVLIAEKYNKADDTLLADINTANYTDAKLEYIADKINGYTGPDITKGNNLGSPPKVKLAIMLAGFAVIAYLVFSVMHK